MQTAAQVWDDEQQVFKNCGTWAQYEWPSADSETQKLCNGGWYRKKSGSTEFYEACPAKAKCRAATDRARDSAPEPRRSLTVLGSSGWQSSSANKLKVDHPDGAVHAQATAVPNKIASTVISPEQVLRQQPAQLTQVPQPPATPTASQGMTEFEQRIAAARTSLAQVKAIQAAAPTPPVVVSPYKYSGMTPDPRVHATPVVPPSTHPAGMQTPFAHDPMYAHQVPIFMPATNEDIGLRLFLNILQGMIAAAGFTLFSYTRAVDLFAGLFR